MFQVTFSEQAMHELNKLDTLTQLAVIEPLGAIKATDLAHPHEPLSHFKRNGKEFFRLRSGEHRFYFQVQAETLHVHYILHKNSFEDFLLRNKFPVSEQQLAEQQTKFWQYLETLRKK